MLYTKKSLGQNYLIDLNIINKIVNILNIKNKNVVEIGPGKGALTESILSKNPKSLILVEKDNKLSENLKFKYRKNKKINIFNEDILKFKLEEKVKKNSIIFGNLPYNISSQILVKFIKFKMNSVKYSDLIFMFQKELANRISGKFGTKDYGRLAVLANYNLNIFKKFDVSPNCFFPKPKVVSSVLHFERKIKKSIKIKNIENLEKITNLLFSNRRKMINKNMKKIFKSDSKLKKIKNLNLNHRPSDIKPEKYYEITNLFERN